MLIKTRAALVEPVAAAVKELHTYATPAVMVLPVESLDPAYHRWIVAETSP
jgi:periplasmic divalent cation tolerance protein